MQSLTNKVLTDHKYWQYKKPFDWMSDEQFVNLQVYLKLINTVLSFQLKFLSKI